MKGGLRNTTIVVKFYFQLLCAARNFISIFFTRAFLHFLQRQHSRFASKSLIKIVTFIVLIFYYSKNTRTKVERTSMQLKIAGNFLND